MRYTVLWSPDAENDLAAIWLAANDRTAVTAAGNQIDAFLHQDAHLQGESRHGRLRGAMIRQRYRRRNGYGSGLRTCPCWTSDTDPYPYNKREADRWPALCMRRDEV